MKAAVCQLPLHWGRTARKKGQSISWFSQSASTRKAEAVAFLKSHLQKGKIWSIKGSRGMRTEEITASLTKGCSQVNDITAIIMAFVVSLVVVLILGTCTDSHTIQNEVGAGYQG